MALTPMMSEYIKTKKQYEDCILFYRLGDFYEMFFDDAVTVSRELELVLTGKNCGLENRAPMCGIPHHAAYSYIPRLIKRGYKVAICEQLEDPKLAKGIVKRGVIKVLTPGTYVDLNSDSDDNTYLMTIDINEESISLSVSDISTGEFKTTTFKNTIITLLDEIAKLAPKEILLSDKIDDTILKRINEVSNALITVKNFDEYKVSKEELIKQFSDPEVECLDEGSIICSEVLLKYIESTQMMCLSNINLLERYDIVNYMTIDNNSRLNLELTENIREKTKKGSLLWVLDKTSTAMGARTIRKWIEEPLISKDRIEKRLNTVEELYNNVTFNNDLRTILSDIYDIERIVGKIANKNVNAKDLISLKTSISMLPDIKNILNDSSSELLLYYYKNLDDLSDIRELLEKAIKDEPSLSIKDGGIIKDGYNSEVDTLRKSKFHGKEWIASLENKEREITGIKSLKVSYNKVFGYYIEVSKANLQYLNDDRYIRKQTLTNAERFITDELKTMEDKILGAEEKIVNLEYSLFVEIRDKIEKEIPRLQMSAKIVSELDALSSLSYVAISNNYVKPNINEEGIINIKDGRHPVVEKMIQSGEFISNDCLLNQDDNEFLIITGPNMAGKSTYMRQTALITLMAQIGSFVPASEANISICDKIFTRIGASDDLAGGKSTFMVEMSEVSNILKNATSKSLVLLDEVGRGTSTYDGLSIAWAVILYITENKHLRCKTLFATHYHELIKLEGSVKGVKNYSIAVEKKDNNIVFLRKIVEGGADESYGIEVAKLAGLPKDVINKARDILASLEKKKDSKKSENKEIIKVTEVETDSKNKKSENIQMDFNSLEKDNLLKKLKNVDMLSLNPMEAMNTLYDIVTEAKKLN
ncbi:DNA mismatch repair protein MutS [Clostridium sp. BJN0001]|uniref:DNA mismatch repair protein MutS n=1 Tax=Clostridium sp. BJN0001 TaxID=2930219 RepID=UPI001FD36FB2|nr:DNA mismatch repair protein MutS [Clostridium sp. BJN0001]